MPLLLVWLFQVGISLGVVTLTAPDARFSQRLAWAQTDLSGAFHCSNAPDCDDVAIKTLALVAIGSFESARDALSKIEHRGPLWVLASYSYWSASADRTFLRTQWPHLATVLFRPAAARIIDDAALELAAADAILAMARELQDTATVSRVEAIYAFADRRAQERAGVLGAALGLIDADNADAEITALADTAYPRYPLAAGFVSMALYEQHRGTEAFALLQSMAASGVSTSSMFVLPLIRGLIGWETDASNRAIGLEPHLPSPWRVTTVSGLVAGRDTIAVTMRHVDNSFNVEISRTRAAPALTVQLSPALPRGARVRSVKANDVDLPMQVHTNKYDTHVTLEFTLDRETLVEIEYDLPLQRPSPR